MHKIGKKRSNDNTRHKHIATIIQVILRARKLETYLKSACNHPAPLPCLFSAYYDRKRPELKHYFKLCYINKLCKFEYIWHNSIISPNLSHYTPIICPNPSHYIPIICPNPSHYIPIICPNPSHYIPIIWPNHPLYTDYLPKSIPLYTDYRQRCMRCVCDMKSPVIYCLHLGFSYAITDGMRRRMRISHM